jgi:hypothetical protein
MCVESIPGLADIAQFVRDNSCVLFLGAGVHAPPPGTDDSVFPAACRPPVGSQLSRRLARRSHFEGRHPDEDPRNLQRVSLDFEIERGRSELVRAVRDEVQTGKSGSPLLTQLAQLNFPLIVTTNFDTHLETALAAVGKQSFVTVYKNNLAASERTDDYPYANPRPETPFVLKIHGDILRAPGSIVITEEDYIQFVLRMSDKEPYHPIPRTARFYLAKFPTLFLGYSLMDYNLRLLFRTLRSQLDAGDYPSGYSVDFRPDPLIYEVLQKRSGQVRYIVEDVWRFVPCLFGVVNGQGAPL